jgi:hypothetical protein
VRELPLAALLAALLATQAALATSPPPAPEPPAAEALEEAPAAEEPAAEELFEDQPLEEEEPTVAGYQEVGGNTQALLEEGALRAWASSSGMRPRRGYTPVQVTLHNTLGAPLTARVTFSAPGARTISRTVELAPLQRLTTVLPVPVESSSGRLGVLSSGGASGSIGLYLAEPEGRGVLVLGTPREFESSTRLPRVDSSPAVSARFLDAKEAPRELAAYVGFDAVMLVDEPAAVPPDAWSALEAYAATGGVVVLARPPRDVRQRLPLLAESRSPRSVYGFGQVVLCEGAATCGTDLLVALSESQVAVNPMGPPPSWQRGRQALQDGKPPLLPNVQAPVGRFLILITLFILLVGPGGVVLARRRGPVALLVAVPAVSLVTCLAIIAWSVWVDGFNLHAARYSLVLLDRPGSRMVVVGVGGYYANLSPDTLRLPTLAALVAPENADALELDWTRGMEVDSGFLPARTYREWGEVAVLPSRARLLARREGDTVRVQNALGAPLEGGYVQLGGRLWRLPRLEEGAEGLALSEQLPSGEVGHVLKLLDEGLLERLSARPLEVIGGQLEEGSFVAQVGGVGPGPASALSLELHAGVHLVRGRLDTP